MTFQSDDNCLKGAPQPIDPQAAERESRVTRVTLWGSVVNLVLTALKILAGVFGHSAAMIADGVHSLSDLMSDVVVLVFIRISSKAKDREHEFGHGKFETLATVIVSLILMAVAPPMARRAYVL